MNQTLVDKIVQAVLCEGDALYPYRRSVRNQHRWSFGGIYPQSYRMAQGGSDAWTMQAQLLVREQLAGRHGAIRHQGSSQAAQERSGL